MDVIKLKLPLIAKSLAASVPTYKIAIVLKSHFNKIILIKKINFAAKKVKMTFLQIEELTKSYGENILFTNISFSILKDEKVALIAKNGIGKTSLLNIITGKDTADDGQITFRNDIEFSYLPQEPVVNNNLTVLEQVFESSPEIYKAISNYEKSLNGNNQSDIDAAINQMDALQAWDFDIKAKQILTELKILNFEKKMGQLSGGEKKRVALTAVLLKNAKLIILDEPTNHLDANMIEWLEEYLQKSNCSLLMVTHDRYFLDRVCNKIIEIDNNTVYTYNGNYSYYLEKRDERIKNKTAEIEKANNLMRTELDWIRRMPKARGTKAKFRIDNFNKLKETASQNIDEKKLDININSKRLGKKILELKNISKSMSGKLLFKNFSYTFSHGQKIGIIGDNGSGKSTFLNIVTQNLQPDIGDVEIGETVVYGYYKQEGITFNPNDRVIDIIKEIAEVIRIGDNRLLSASQFLEYFLFPSKMHYSLVEKLSGGERRRLYLMTVLIKNPNFLILDEPTNDLDIMTLNVLENYLANFKGCVIIVSHDRYFIDKVVDSLFIFKNNATIKDFPGNYSIYKNKLDEEKTITANKPDDKPKKEKPKQKQKKFGFKQKRELELLDNELEDLNTKKKLLETKINSGECDQNELLELSSEIGKIIDTIDQKELRWLELQELAENDT